MRITCYDSFGNPLDKLTQWDINRKIKVSNVECKGEVRFHILNDKSTMALRLPAKTENGMLVTNIPNELLRNATYIIVGIFDHMPGETGEGRTIGNFRIPVSPFPQPDDYDYVENIDYKDWVAISIEAQAVIDELKSEKAYLDNIAAETKSNVTKTQQNLDSTKTAASNAEQSAAEAKQSATSAMNYANDAKNNADLAIKTAIKGDVSGNPIVISDSVDGVPTSFMVQGSTTQHEIRHLHGSVISVDKVAEGQTVPCKVESDNILPFPYYEGTKEQGGLNYNVGEDGTITVTGNANGFSTFLLARRLPINDLKSFTLSGIQENPVNIVYGVTLYDSSDSVVQIIQVDTLKDVVVDLSNYPDAVAMNVQVKPNKQDNAPTNFTVYPMLNRGTSPLPYTKHVDVAQSKVKALGTNIYNKANTIGAYFTNTLVAHGGHLTLYAKVPHNTDITVSKTIKQKNPRFAIGFANELPKIGTTVQNVQDFANETAVTVNSKNYDYILCWFGFTGGGNTENEEILKDSMQVEIGDKATTHVLYTETTYDVQPDGTVVGVQSVSPNMTLMSDTEGVTIDAIIPEPIVNGVATEVSDTGANLASPQWFVDNGCTLNDENEIYCDDNNRLYGKRIFESNGNRRIYLDFWVKYTHEDRDGSYPVIHYKDGTRDVCGIGSGKRNVYTHIVKASDPNKEVVAINFSYSSGSSLTYFKDFYIGYEEVFEPFKGKTLKFSQPIELSKWDSIVKDTDGLWKKRINVSRYKATEKDIYKGGSFYVKINGKKNQGGIYSEILKDGDYRTEKYAMSNDAPKFGDVVYITFEKSFTIEQNKTFVNNNNVVITYETETPIYETLTEADQLMLNSLETFYPNTILQTDEGVTLNVKYIVDTNSYIDNKVLELQQTMVALGSL